MLLWTDKPECRSSLEMRRCSTTCRKKPRKDATPSSSGENQTSRNFRGGHERRGAIRDAQSGGAQQGANLVVGGAAKDAQRIDSSCSGRDGVCLRQSRSKRVACPVRAARC